MWFALYNNMFGEPINCTVFISLRHIIIEAVLHCRAS